MQRSNSYQVLARKWRPKNFTEVVGQEHVLRALSNGLLQKRLHHAYLLTGTRGVGKTTIARILAKCFNCETGITATPCCECDVCNAIDSGRFIDLIEVDAASRTKVEDTRDLLENVQYLPNSGRFKIYLIDEVHMLSGHSFNALLKTLEEPPQHVKFLLATTDPQKLPVTVLSRCLQFNLKNLTPEIIQKQLQNILSQEKIIYDDNALYKIALAAKGSVRDALSLLDQAIAYGNGTVKNTEVAAMLGTIENNFILQLLDALCVSDANNIMQIIADLAAAGTDFLAAVDELLIVLHQIALQQVLGNSADAKIMQLAKNFTLEDIQLYYQIALIGKRDLSLAPNPQSGFEMILLRMLHFIPDNFVNTRCAVPSATPSAAPIISSNENANLLANLKLSGASQALIRHCTVKKISDNLVELLLEPKQAALLNKNHEERISKALSEYFGKSMRVQITIGDANIPTLAKIETDAKNLQQEKNKQAIMQDENVKNLMNVFNATIVTDE